MGFRSLFKKKKKTKPGPTPSLSRSPSSNLNDELRIVFQKFDANGDGKISSSELGSILAMLGQPATSSELDHMIREVDADGDGFINMDEFVALNNIGLDTDEVLRDAFSVFDVDKNGLISDDELMRILMSLGEDCTLSECKKMITGFDHDGDGKISFEEFKAMMAKGISFVAA